MRVLVLGGGDGLSSGLAADLEASFGPGSCGLSRRGEGEPAGEILKRRPEAVVYLAAARGDEGGPLLADADLAWRSCLDAGVPQVVAVGSTEAIEPSHRHPGRAPEQRSTPRRAALALRERWLDFEEGAHARLGGSAATTLALLRAAPPLASGLPTAWCRLLASPWAATLPGRDPTLQFLAPEDLGRAVAEVVAARARGLFHVVPRANVPLRQALRLAGVRRLPWPALLRRRSALVPYLRHPWTASGERLWRELGVEPQRSSAEAVLEFRSATKGEGAAADLATGPGTGPASAGPPPGHGRRKAGAARAGFDAFGLDPAFIEAFRRTLFRFLHDAWWRVEVRGLEELPREGPALLVGVHRGFMPWDGVMALHEVAGATGRYPRFLVHPALLKFPFLADFMTKLGGIPASLDNAAWVLEREEMVAIFPDGIRGAFTPYRDAYRIGRSFRDEFARLALAHRAPIVPFCTVGSAETFPIVGRLDWAWWRRLSEWPYLPVTASLPFLPNPSKWHTWYLPPLPVASLYPPAAAGDPEAVASLAAEVRRRLESALATMLARRRSIFRGRVFGESG